MSAVGEIVVKLMVELISTLALVTRNLKKRRLRESSLICYFTQRDAVKWANNFFGVKDINTAHQRLDRFLQGEDRAAKLRLSWLLRVSEHPRLVIRPQGVNIVNSRSFDDALTPLHFTSHNGHVELARMLVERDADLSAQKKNGWTAQPLASLRDHVDLARMLIERGSLAVNGN